MRPPECEVCGEGRGATSCVLVRCVSRESDLAWHERVARDGMVGHPPDTGWFCATHADAARELAPTHGLAAVVAAIRDAGAREDLGVDTSIGVGVGVGVEAVGSPWAGRDIGDLYQALRVLLPEIAAHAGLDVSAIGFRENRDYSMMDGCHPPDCPYTDTSSHYGADGAIVVSLELTATWWSPRAASGARVSLLVHGAGERDFRVAASSDRREPPLLIEGVRVTGEPPAGVGGLIDAGPEPEP